VNLRPARFEDESNIRCEFQLDRSADIHSYATLIAKFAGRYREGSGGNPDARFICGMLKAAIEVWRPGALVINFSELDYVWGDEMDWFLSPTFNNLPAAVVIGPGCAAAIATLIWGLNTNRPATDADFVFDTVQKAWESVRLPL
jgi:hypothetical protein